MRKKMAAILFFKSLDEIFSEVSKAISMDLKLRHQWNNTTYTYGKF